MIRAKVTEVSNEHHTRVSRLTCRLCGKRDKGSLVIDVHTGVFPVTKGSELEIVLVSGEKDDDRRLRKTYEYMMRGQVLHVEKDSLYVSFSGLMLCARENARREMAWKRGSRVCCYLRVVV